MSAWKAKRFWKAAQALACDGGFTVQLDGRAVKTPARQALVVPTLAMAEAIALEWDAQQGVVKPDTMPVTRSANSALDKLVPQFDAVVDVIAAYGETDLLCYRATDPEPLIARQAVGWDPLLDWSASALGAPLIATAGVMHIPQRPETVTRLRAHVAACTPFELVALHDLVAISGSLVLGLAVARKRLTVEDAWTLSRIDEHWQAELWGVDEDAAALEQFKRTAMIEADRFFGLCG